MKKAEKILKYFEDKNKPEMSLHEMAFHRGHALKKVDDLSLVIAKHLFKYYFSTDKNNMRGWKKELHAWHEDISSLRKGKKGANNFGKKELMKFIWSNPFGDEGDLEHWKKIQERGGLNIRDVSDKDEFKKFVESYIESILDEKKPIFP